MTEDEKKENIKKLFEQANSFFKDKEYSNAIECYNQILEIDENNIDALHDMGSALHNQKKYDDAIEYYDKALNTDKNDIDTLNSKGNTLRVQKQYNKAIEYYNKVLNIDENNINALNNKGNALYDLRKYEEAIECYNIILGIDEDNINALNNKGSTLDDLRKYEEAIECYNVILGIDENNINALNNKGVTLSRQQKYEEAIECYDKILELNKNDINALNNKGVALRLLKKYPEAASYYIKAEKKSFDLFLTNQDETLLSYMLDEDRGEDSGFWNTLRKHRTKHNITEDPNYQKYKSIYIKTLQIILKLQVQHDFEKEVAHYTIPHVARLLLIGEKNESSNIYEQSPLWLTSIAKANDPKEGEILFEYLEIDDKYRKECNNYQAFIACFTFNTESLNQFRLYGKEDDREATGVSIIMNKQFFASKVEIGSLNPEVKSKGKIIKDTSDPETTDQENLSLFRCIYIDPQTKRIISIGHKEEYAIYREKNEVESADLDAYYKEIKKKTTDIGDELEKLKNLVNEPNLNQDVIRDLLLILRYFVKHVAFKEEHECRILRIKSLNKNENIKFLKNDKMYFEHNTINSKGGIKDVSKIIVAPQFKDFEIFRDQIKWHTNIDCYQSDHPFSSAEAKK